MVTILRAGALLAATLAAAPAAAYDFHDAHAHLTDYAQRGPSSVELLALMGHRAGRSVLFGVPLQQLWSFRVDGSSAPAGYQDSDAPLYYYSFTDAVTAQEYLYLSPRQRARLDPMITGFNPADMYAAEHVRRVLTAFPGVFEGVGEFSLRRALVTSKVAGETPSVSDPALDRLLDLSAEAGLVVLIHDEADQPFGLRRTLDLLGRHPQAVVIWAHLGLGPARPPARERLVELSRVLDDPAYANVHFDLSGEDAARVLTADAAALDDLSALINAHPERFLFGSDAVAPRAEDGYFRVYEAYAPLWKKLSPEASRAVRLTNYERIFDRARARVRAWERLNGAQIVREGRKGE